MVPVLLSNLSIGVRNIDNSVMEAFLGMGFNPLPICKNSYRILNILNFKWSRNFFVVDHPRCPSCQFFPCTGNHLKTPPPQKKKTQQKTWTTLKQKTNTFSSNFFDNCLVEEVILPPRSYFPTNSLQKHPIKLVHMYLSS